MYFHAKSTAIIALSFIICMPATLGALIVTAESLSPGPSRLGGRSVGAGGLFRIGATEYRGFVGQTFYASTSGAFTSFKVVIDNLRDSQTGNDLTFTLHRIDQGVLGLVLDTAVVSYSDVAVDTGYVAGEPYVSSYKRGYNATALFEGGVIVEQGVEYAVAIDSYGNQGSHYRIWCPTSPVSSFTDTYTEGRRFSNEVDGIEYHRFGEDLFFQVTVDTVPEPSPAILLGISIAGLLFRRMR